MALDLSFPPSLAPTPALSVTSDPLDRKRSFVVGTRKSALALIQTQLIATHLKAANKNLEFPVISNSTIGDRNQTTPLHLLSPYSSSQPAKSLWTDELEVLLAEGRFDVIVHSLKDVPTTLKEGFELGCCFEREDPRDAVVMREGSTYKTLDELPDGSIVGTGSVRRVAQLRRAYPKLRFEDMRGNLNTRLSKLDSPTSHFSALILAIAGMTRLGQAHRITAPLSSPVLLHAVGQGALGIEIRRGDREMQQILRSIGCWKTEWRCGAERGLLRVLEGGCSVPVGVETILTEVDATHSTSNGSSTSEAGYGESSFSPLSGSSPLLHFSGLLVPSTPIPESSAGPTETASYIEPRRATLKLMASVTSVDGSVHVLYDAPEQIVTSYRSAEAWGEECARRLRKMGASEVLDKINRERKERELADLERLKKEGVEVHV